MIFSKIGEFFGAKRLDMGRASSERFIDLVSATDYYTPPPANARELIRLYKDHPWVRSIVGKIAGAVAAQEWYFERPNGERVDAHPALDFLRAGTSRLRGRQARKITVAHVDLAGESFWIVGRKGETGPPVQFAPIPPDWVKDVPDHDDDPGAFFEIVPKLGRVMRIPAGDVIWIRDADPLDPYGRGVGVTASARTEISTDANASKFLDAYLKNSARPDMIISGSKESPLGKDDRPRVEAYWNERHRGALRAGRPFFSAQPLTVTELGKGLRNEQFAEVREQLKAAMSEIFGIPPEIMGRLENSNRATIESADYLFAKHVVAPRLDLLSDHLAPWIADNFNARGLLLKYENPVQEDKAFALNVATAKPSAFTKNELRELAGFRRVSDVAFDEFPDDPPPPGSEAPVGNEGDDTPAGNERDDTPAEDKTEPVTVEKSAPVVKILSPADVVQVSSAHEDPQVRAEVTRMLDELFDRLIEAYGSELLGELAKEVQFRETASLIEWLSREVPELVGQIDKTTRDALRASLVEGVAVNEAVAALTARVEAVFADAADVRASTIGNTIATKIAGRATLEAAKQAGMTEKRWLSSRDQVVRSSHSAMDGQRVPINRPFKSPNGGEAQHPGAFGEAAEDVNCRCAMRPVLPGEGKALGPSDDDFRRFHEARFDRIAKEASTTIKNVFAAQKAVALFTVSVLARLP